MFRKQQRFRGDSRFGNLNYAATRGPSRLRSPFPRFRRRASFNSHSSPNSRPMARIPYCPRFPSPRAPVQMNDNSQNLSNRSYPNTSDSYLVPNSCAVSHQNLNVQFSSFQTRLPPSTYQQKNAIVHPNQLDTANIEVDDYLWIETKTADGKTYYYHAKTRLTQWEKPINVKVISWEQVQLIRPRNIDCQHFTQQNNVIAPSGLNSTPCIRPYFNPEFPTPRPPFAHIRPPIIPPGMLIFPPPVVSNPQLFATTPSQTTVGNFHSINVNVISESNNTTASPPVVTVQNQTATDCAFNVQLKELPEQRSSALCSQFPVSDVRYCETYNPVQGGDMPTEKQPIDNKANADESDAFVSVVESTGCDEIVASELIAADSDKGHVDAFSLQQKEEIKEDTRNCQSAMDETLPAADHSLESEKNITSIIDNKSHPTSCTSTSGTSRFIDLSVEGKENITLISVNNSRPTSCTPMSGTSWSVDHSVESKRNVTSIDVNKSRPTSCTPISGSSWCVVWTGDAKVFFYDASRKLSVWGMPIELTNRSDVRKLIEAPPLIKYRNQSKEGPNNKKIKTSEETTSTSVGTKNENSSARKMEKTTSVGTQEESTSVSGKEGSTSVSAKEESTSVSGKEGSTSVSAKEESTSVSAKGESTSVSAKGESTSVSAKEESAAISIKEESSAISKTEENTSVGAKEEGISVTIIEENTIDFQTKALQERAAIPYEVRVEKFRQMLVEKNVSAFSTWEKELYKIVFDPRYLLLTSKERKREFQLFIRERVDEEKSEKKRQHRQLREGYRSLLLEAGIDSKMKFTDFVQRYNKDERFKAIEKIKDKESMFLDFVNDMLIREREQIFHEKKQEADFNALLKEQVISESTTWEEIEEVISNDERFQAIRSDSRRQSIFRNFISKYSEQKMDRNSSQRERARASIKSREEEVKRDLSVHLQIREKEQAQHKHDSAVSCLKALLVDLVRDTDVSWKSARKILRKDNRYESVRNLPTAKRERLFDEHIAVLNIKKREAYRKMLDGISEITLTTDWHDIKAVVLHDPAYTKFSNDEKNCEKQFKEYQREKLNMAKKDFKQLLKETKTITYKTKSLMNNPHYLEAIEDILKNDKRYLVLEEFETERKEILLSYIEKLHEFGPPPPPTASDPRR